jgi:SAM-dependent methyltransferase
VAWFLLCELPAGIGVVPGEASPGILAFAGLALFPPALVWRLLVRVIPDEAPLPQVPPPPDLAAIRVHQQNARAEGTAAGEVTLAEVRATTAAAVSAAVEAAVASLPGGRGAAPPPSSSYARAWDAEREAAARAAARRAARQTDLEWDRRAVERTFFETYLQPCLTPLSRVLEIGAGSDVYTAWTAAEVASVTCVDVDARNLECARQELEEARALGLVRGDGRGLDAFVTGAFDVVLSCEAFRRLDQESIYRHLLEVRRVLRPGGRALLLFANLLDPEGFKNFEAAARRAGDEERINFLTPEAIRTLIEAADLALESLHLAAHDCDLLAILQHEPLTRSDPATAKESG